MQFKNLLEKYGGKKTLKFMAAKTIVDSQIPYKDKLPKNLVKFVSLH